jgi:hypothetical protein
VGKVPPYHSSNPSDPDVHTTRVSARPANRSPNTTVSLAQVDTQNVSTA